MKSIVYTAALTFMVMRSFAQPISTEAWLRDIEFIRTELPSHHPDFYLVNSIRSWNSQLDELQNRLSASGKQYSSLDIALSIQKIIASMGDDHTFLDYVPLTKGTHRFPMKLDAFPDGYFVLGTYGIYKDILGKKILAINSVPMDSIEYKLSLLSGRTNEAFIRQKVNDMLDEAALLEHIGVMKGNEAEFTYRQEDGSTGKITIAALNAPPGGGMRPVAFTPKGTPLYLTNERALFWSAYLQEKGIVYAQYNLCDSREVQEKIGNTQRAAQLPSFTAFSDDLIAKLKMPGVKAFVLDLRFNTGGSSQPGMELSKKIAAQTPFHTKGKTFVITGAKTFSSAVNNAIDFKKNCNALLVGEATGGKPNHFGQAERLKLPNTGLTIIHATRMLTITEKDTPSLIPDIPAETSFADYAAGRDRAFEAIESYK